MGCDEVVFHGTRVVRLRVRVPASLFSINQMRGPVNKDDVIYIWNKYYLVNDLLVICAITVSPCLMILQYDHKKD